MSDKDSESEKSTPEKKTITKPNLDTGNPTKTKAKSELSLKDVISYTTPFDGTNVAFKEWSKTLVRNIELAQVEDNYGEILFSKLLIDKAKLVWEMAETDVKTSIVASLKILKGTFDNNNTRLEAEEKIHNTKQADFSSVFEYVKVQVKNCKASDNSMTEETIVAHIRRNLLPEFKKQIYLWEFKSVEQLVMALDKVEKNVKVEKAKTEVNFLGNNVRSSRGRGRYGNSGRYGSSGSFGRHGNTGNSGRYGNTGIPRNNYFNRNNENQDSQRPRYNKSFKNIQCFNCGNFGHTQRQCHPNKQVKMISKEDEEEAEGNKVEHRNALDTKDYINFNKEDDSL